MPKIETIHFTYKGYGLTAEYFYSEDRAFQLVGIMFDNPTQTLMFLYENCLGTIDKIDRAVCTIVAQKERDEQEYKIARDRVEQWLPRYRSLKD